MKISDSEGEVPEFIVDDEDFGENFEDDYSEMNVVELKNIRRVRGLAITGRKRDIIDRLEEFDENGPVWDEIERPIHIPTFRKVWPL